MKDSDNRPFEIPSRCQPNLGSESTFFSNVREVETTQMEPTLVKQLNKSLQQPLPPWSHGFGKTWLLSAVGSPEPRRVMVNGWDNVRFLFLSDFNVTTRIPLGLRDRFQNKKFTDDRNPGSSRQIKEIASGDEGEGYARQSTDTTTPCSWEQGSRDTVETSGSAIATSAELLTAQSSAKTEAPTPKDESFDEFVNYISSF